MAILQTHLARAYPAIGDHAAGTEHASQAIRLYESIAAMSPGNAHAQADLLNAWFSYAESADYGDATPSPQLLEQIRSAYRAALELCDGLLKNTPGNPQWMGRAAEIQFRIGRLSFALHDAAGAKAALERAHALAIEVADRV